MYVHLHRIYMYMCMYTMSCILYRLLNRQSEEWGDKVSVVSCDMRKWEAPEKVRFMGVYYAR